MCRNIGPHRYGEGTSRFLHYPMGAGPVGSRHLRVKYGCITGEIGWCQIGATKCGQSCRGTPATVPALRMELTMVPNWIAGHFHGRVFGDPPVSVDRDPV